jgi:hypothetical protein
VIPELGPESIVRAGMRRKAHLGTTRIRSNRFPRQKRCARGDSNSHGLSAGGSSVPQWGAAVCHPVAQERCLASWIDPEDNPDEWRELKRLTRIPR